MVISKMKLENDICYCLCAKLKNISQNELPYSVSTLDNVIL